MRSTSCASTPLYGKIHNLAGSPMNGILIKKIRGVAKQFFPYCVESAYVRRKYGIVNRFDNLRRPGVLLRIGRLVAQVLPYGLVTWCQRRKMASISADLHNMAEELGLFERKWYVARNPDVDFSSVDPLEHFFAAGWKEYRDPSEYFSVGGYLSRYPDVLLSGMNPLTHFLVRGRWEGRDTCAPGPFLGGAPTLKDRFCALHRKRRPFFSVVVASYNYEDLVIETLEGLATQTYRDFEVIVVDDGSQDASRENVLEFIRKHADDGVRMTLYTHPDCANRGLAETVRLGVEKCVGEYVAFCEADDVWTPDHLEEISSFIGRFGAAEVVVNDVEIFGNPVRVARFNAIKALRYKELRHVRNRITPAMMRDLNYLLTFSATAVRRRILAGVDWHPVARPAALDWWLWRQLCFNRPVYFVDKILTRWRMHDSYMFRAHSAADQASTMARMQKDFLFAGDRLLLRRHPFSPSAWLMAMHPAEPNPYTMTPRRTKAFMDNRRLGLEKCADMIRRNSGTRILVCLHLFYEEAWDLISRYLENLSPYKTDFVVTCVEGRVSDATLARMRAFSDSLRVVFTPNRGFDIGPFVETIREIDLDRYDVVFKLQSKGVKRPRIYIYNQLFKTSDWFFNLFDGVLDGVAVHECIDALMNGGARLVAAENLVVSDPKHKVFFMRRFCEERGLPFVDGYRFVAGTCFAARSDVMKPLKELGLSIEDFAAAKPGEFSLAHALERWMCFAAAGAMKGIPVRHNEYRGECAALASKNAVRLLDDSRFELDYDFFYRVLEMRPVSRYSVVRARLGDLTRYWYDGRLYPLEECPPYKYLCGDRKAYEDYCALNAAVTGFEMSPERFEKLCASMATYNPRLMPVVFGPRNIVQDGQHRTCILLKKFGPDHVIDVLRID